VELKGIVNSARPFIEQVVFICRVKKLVLVVAGSMSVTCTHAEPQRYSPGSEVAHSADTRDRYTSPTHTY